MLYKSKIQILRNGLIRVYDYDKPLQCGVAKIREDYTKNEKEHKEIDSIKSLNRVRNDLKNLIDNNVSQYSKFITLTYKITNLDRNQVLKDFNRFCDRFEYHYHERPRYVAILEHQKERGKKEGNEGSYHIHMILFNDFKLDLIYFQNQVWKLGTTNTTKVDSTSNLGRYLMKYITKEMYDMERLFGKKSILRSHNLKEVKSNYYVENMNDAIAQIPDKTLTYEKNYKVKAFERQGDEVVEVEANCTLYEYNTISK